MKEEIQRQIELIERTKATNRATVQDAQKVVDLLGGELVVDMSCDTLTFCYYLTLLVLKKQAAPAP